MPIYKINKQDNWSTVDNRVLSSPKIAATAKVVLFYLLSKPNDWRVYEADIIKHMREGRYAVQAALKGLRDLGYIVRRQRFKGNGQFDGYDYDVYERPQLGVAKPTRKVEVLPAKHGSPHEKIRTFQEFAEDRESPFSSPAEEEHKRMIEVGG